MKLPLWIHMEFQARNTFLDLPNYFQLELHLWELDVSFQFQQLPGLHQEYTYKHMNMKLTTKNIDTHFQTYRNSFMNILLLGPSL